MTSVAVHGFNPCPRVVDHLQVETETAADMTVLYVEKSQRTAEQHARQLEGKSRACEITSACRWNNHVDCVGTGMRMSNH